ncbi:MAG: PHP domain-containing protein [Eggerthellaceae bacterium]|nr:PHP domain-containing protein [Eggerthellaceae bacterium]
MQRDVRIDRIRRIVKDDYFRLSPRIVPANAVMSYRLTDQFRLFSNVSDILIEIVPTTLFDRGVQNEKIKTSFINGVAEFNVRLDCEQEYIFKLCDSEGEMLGVELDVFALNEDLLPLAPLKGDLHMHTAYSDGFELPSHKLAMARKRGLDYVAITDHNNFNGSLVAIEDLTKCPNRMIALKGEEVHAGGKDPGSALSPVHILSIDADYGVSFFRSFSSDAEYLELRNQLEAEFDVVAQDNPWLLGLGKECAIAEIEKARKRRLEILELADTENGEHPYWRADEFAYTLEACEAVKDAGGLCVLCHPMWRPITHRNTVNRMDVSLELVKRLLEANPFDACEIVSGAPKSEAGSNLLQERLYYESGLVGRIPMIGITDNHIANHDDYDLLGNNYSVVFAAERTARAIREAIEDGRCVAVEHYDGECARIHGDFRLSQFASFLIRTFFKAHDRNAAMEGNMMEKVLAYGDEIYSSILAHICELHASEEREWWGAAQSCFQIV